MIACIAELMLGENSLIRWIVILQFEVARRDDQGMDKRVFAGLK